MVKTAALILLLMVSRCSLFNPEPAPIADPRAVWCEQNEPRRPSAAEIAVMSRDDKDIAVAHNRRGVLWCGWLP